MNKCEFKSKFVEVFFFSQLQLLKVIQADKHYLLLQYISVPTLSWLMQKANQPRESNDCWPGKTSMTSSELLLQHQHQWATNRGGVTAHGGWRWLYPPAQGGLVSPQGPGGCCVPPNVVLPRESSVSAHFHSQALNGNFKRHQI